MTLWGRSAVEALTEQLSAASDADEILKTLEAAVGGRVPPEPDPPSFADELAARVAAGTSVAELAGWMGTNTRQVARRCDDIFGMAPTRLRRVLRLQQAARHRFEHPGLSLSELASASGYSDQSHLSRDSRELAASTPRAAFG
ncbi:helix-turn-helix domain-containing protein [Phycicoccus mangrovi]|uniref:helix-turn-helix domain-containing protein n=2 Tax=Phycicoccus mangrovi TaxID=2840470 RepID=UPI001D003B66